MDPIVSAAWLAEHAHDRGLVIFEATKFLPGQDNDGLVAYRQAHIPGARYFDLDVIADTDSALPHMVPAAGRFARLVGELGVSNDSTVVFYDQNGTMWATRGWWMMGLFGHDRVAVLDGGLAAWREAGLPVETGEAPPAPLAHFTPRLRAERLRGLGDMQASEALVLDARAAGRFTGSVPEPRPGLVPGHIPGSVNIPSSTLLAPDGRFLPADALRARLMAAGAGAERPIVTSCGSGVSATVISMALRLAGLPEGAVYDGSWSEWGADPTTLKETG